MQANTKLCLTKTKQFNLQAKQEQSTMGRTPGQKVQKLNEDGTPKLNTKLQKSLDGLMVSGWGEWEGRVQAGRPCEFHLCV